MRWEVGLEDCGAGSWGYEAGQAEGRGAVDAEGFVDYCV